MGKGPNTHLPDDFNCNIAIYADDTTLYSKYHQASDLWQQLEFASELESDKRDTVNFGRKWHIYFNAVKTRLVLFDQSNNTGAIDVKMDWSVIDKKSLFKMLGWLSLLNRISVLTLFLLLQVPPRKMKPWLILWSFFLLRLIFIFINLPYTHVGNTVATSGLVPLLVVGIFK